MTNQEIIALAREYAEEITKDIPSDNDIKSLRESAIKLNAEVMEKHLRWLLRRYALVEKSKVEQMYKEAVEGKCELEKMRPQNTYAKNSILMRVGMNAGCAYTLKSLFPEIAKEVEG